MRKTLLSAAFVAAAAAGTNFVAANPAMAQVVIAEVYSGGGATGTSTPIATYQNDFIVLYNNGPSAVDLSTWAIQYSASSGTNTTGFNAYGFTSGSTIGADSYFFILGGAAATSAQGSAIPTGFHIDADASTSGLNASFSLAMGQSGGQVALTNSTATLPESFTGNATNLTYTGVGTTGAGMIMDFVGFGSSTTTVNRYEGTGPAPVPAKTQSINRTFNSGTLTYTDTNNNASDFMVGAPTLYNSQTVVGGGSAAPEPGSLLLLAAFAPGAFALTRRRKARRVAERDTEIGTQPSAPTDISRRDV